MFKSHLTPHPLMSLKSRALRALSQREYSRSELEQKLLPFANQEGELHAVLEELTQKGFLNEARHAQALARKRSEKLGLARIRQEFKAKGVPEALTQEVLEPLRHTELERAQAIWQKRFGHAPQDLKEAQRQERFLRYRGFSAQTVHTLLKQAQSLGSIHREHEL